MITARVQLKVSGESRPGAHCLMEKKKPEEMSEETSAGLIFEAPQDRSDREVCGKQSPFKKMPLAKEKVALFWIFLTKSGFSTRAQGMSSKGDGQQTEAAAGEQCQMEKGTNILMVLVCPFLPRLRSA